MEQQKKSKVTRVWRWKSKMSRQRLSKEATSSDEEDHAWACTPSVVV